MHAQLDRELLLGARGDSRGGPLRGGHEDLQCAGYGLQRLRGEVLPQAESCTTASDDNCNGQINEGCSCTPGSKASCYSGPAGTLGVGICAAGTQTCNAQGSGYGACTGEVTPQVETCMTPGDEDCNGQANEGGTGCVCSPGATMGCYSGPAGTAGVGLCAAGTRTCNAQGTAYGACAGRWCRSRQRSAVRSATTTAMVR